MSDSGKEIVAGQSGRLRFEIGNNRFIQSDGSTDIFLFGQRLDGSLGVDLAQAGSDVKTAPDNELIFSSKFNLFKIVASGTHVFDNSDFVSSGNSYLDYLAAFNFNHGLSDPPIILAFMEVADGSIRALPHFQFDYDTGALTYQIVAYVNSTSVHIEVRSTDVLSPGVPVRYYVLQETASA